MKLEEPGACDREAVGINVIGHVGANLGVGVATRQVIELVQRLGRPVAAFDVDRGTKRVLTERRFDAVTVDSADDLPYRINLYVLGLHAVDWALGRCPDRLFDADHFNALVCFWELPVIPAARAEQLDEFDAIVGASDFLCQVYRQTLRRATVVSGPLPIAIPPVIPFARATLGIPDDATAFVFSFDPASDPARKNPDAVVRAFVDGVGDLDDAWLVMRINNAMQPDGSSHPVVAALRRIAGSHPRIVFLTDALSYPEVLGLYRACDVFVSLHRAEGLGLGMAEAMALGLPVIATGWSGNLSFMRATGACLVDYRMVPVRATLSAYREYDLVGTACWADPDVAHAAACMRWLATDAAARKALGAAAATEIACFNEVAARGAFVEELSALERQRRALAALGIRSMRNPGRPALHLRPAPWGRRVARVVDDLATRAGNRLRKIGLDADRRAAR